jgi:steroid delta-isomerase
LPEGLKKLQWPGSYEYGINLSLNRMLTFSITATTGHNMLTSTDIRERVNHYIDMMNKSDLDGIMAMFTEDAVVEDPVGGNRHEGKEAIRQFYSAVIAALTIELRGPICVASNHCAFLLLVRHDFEEHSKYLDATDCFTFDEAGKIADMKAYMGIEEVRDAP